MTSIIEAAKNEELNIICKICGERFKYLGSHLWMKHKIKSQNYKEKFGLQHKLKLLSDEVKENKQNAFNKRKEVYLKNLTKEGRFKKGHKIREKGYFSKYEKDRLIDRIKEHDYKGFCEICKTSFDNVNSHLFNKHGLIKVKSEQNQEAES